MSESHCCSVTLIVVGDDLDPDAVTSALGWTPDRSWRRGERKRFPLPDGRTRVFDSVHDWGGWKCFLTAPEKALPLQEQLAIWLDRLRDRGPALGTLSDRGWEAELDCFAATTEVLHLPRELLADVAALGLGLCVTFSAYAPEPGAAAT